jgi:hypothetical protein
MRAVPLTMYEAVDILVVDDTVEIACILIGGVEVEHFPMSLAADTCVAESAVSTVAVVDAVDIVAHLMGDDHECNQRSRCWPNQVDPCGQLEFEEECH